jgi:hypothetical protein
MKTKENIETMSQCLRLVQSNLSNAIENKPMGREYWLLETMNRLNSCIWKALDSEEAEKRKKEERKERSKKYYIKKKRTEEDDEEESIEEECENDE